MSKFKRWCLLVRFRFRGHMYLSGCLYVDRSRLVLDAVEFYRVASECELTKSGSPRVAREVGDILVGMANGECRPPKLFRAIYWILTGR